MSPALFIFLRIALAIQGYSTIQVLGLFLFCFCKKYHWNFDKDCITFIDEFG